MPPEANHCYSVGAILRACEVLKVFRMEREELRLQDFMDRTGLQKATAYRTLRSLVTGGLLERVGRDRYRSLIRLMNRTRFRFGYTEMTHRSVYSREVTDSIQRAAAIHDVELITLDNQYSSKVALRNAEILVRERVNFALQVQVHEDVAALIAARFAEANIPAIAIDIPQPGATFFGGNNYAAGRMGGQALARWAQKHWDGRVDQVLLLGLRAAGPLPQSRMTGVAIGVQDVLPEVSEKHIIQREANGGYAESLEAVRKHLRLVRKGRFLVSAMNDTSALGALRAFEESGRQADCAVVGMNATLAGRIELRRNESRLIGSVAFFPETYGDHIIPIAFSLLQQKPIPPAVYVKHVLITPANVNKFYPAEDKQADPNLDSYLMTDSH